MLIVDDEQAVADTQAARLAGYYETETVYGGEAALDRAGPAFDAILLDRRMPDIHGDDVLDRLRERGYEGAVVMLTAVDPDLNILEMGFDDYLCKPVDRETLLAALDQQLSTPDRDARLDEYFEITAKLAVLEAEKTPGQLDTSSEYRALRNRADELETTLRTAIDDFEALVQAHESIRRETG
ncbi:response regulator [Halomicroarcula sp. GCM10025709]|uniref:response regulator n=1 Tax=Haloarcula TaxID=2237 RepID=UPI0024C3A7CE|nr:response regulator [Halomicroarcula sp. YJ-61-S]